MALPSRETFWNEVFPAQRPVVWRGAANHLPLVELGRRGPAGFAAALTSMCGERPVSVSAVPPSAKGKLGFSIESWADWSRYTTTVEQLLCDLVREQEQPSGRTLYMQAMPVDRAIPELLPLTELEFADASKMFKTTTQMWMGSGGQRLATHQDATHSVVTMVSGVKEFLLFPPDQHFNLYTGPHQELFKYPWRSVVDPQAPDFEKYPAFKEALRHAELVRIEAGDSLFLPAGWWHAVHSLGFNVMFNTRWLDVDAAAFDDASCSFAHAVVAARAMPTTAHTDFQAAIASALSRPIAPLPTAEREQLLSTLRGAVRSVPGALSDASTLTLNPQSALRLGPTGVIASDQSHAEYTLPWDFAPLLALFDQPRALAEIVKQVQADFDVDREALVVHLEGLVRSGFLLESPTASAITVATALAHVKLSTAELPQHHRDAIRLWVEVYGLHRQGDPYPYLPAERQGMLGPTSEKNQAELAALVLRGLKARYGAALIDPATWSKAVVVRTGMQLKPQPAELQFTDGAGSTKQLPWQHLELLSLFHAPRSPTEVFTEVGQRWSLSEAAFRSLVGEWLVQGVLVVA